MGYLGLFWDSPDKKDSTMWEHRKKLYQLWNGANIHNYQQFNWIPRLTTSRKLSHFPYLFRL